MKKIALSIAIGVAITWLLYIYANQPSNGPRFIAYFLVPFQLLASSITKDRDLGEIIYFGAQILLISSICYVGILSLTINLKKRPKN